MCGRYALNTSPQALAAFFRLAGHRDPVRRYNIAPTQTASVIVQHANGSREIEAMRWGLIPAWAKDATIANRLINARSESAAEKPAFKKALAMRRCVVPVSGFFEWQKRGSRKQPYYIARADGQPMALGGLWETWVNRDTGEEVRTFTILTTSANAQVAPIHDRMPAVLEAEDVDLWLDPSVQDASSVQHLLRPATEGILSLSPVSDRVNKPENDDAAVLLPVESEIDKNKTPEPGLFG